MAQYTPKTWTTGETITAAELNALEQAAAAAAVKVDADAAYDTKGAATAAQAAAILSAATDAATRANTAQANAVQRANHTGTQAATTITGLATVATSGAYTDAQAVTANASAVAGRAPLLVPTATKTAAYTAAVGDLAVMNVPGGAAALTLPTAPADKAQAGFVAIGATTGTPLVVSRGGTDTLGVSAATSVTVPLSGEVTVYQYDAANTRWLPVANVKPLTALDARYSTSGGTLRLVYNGTWPSRTTLTSDPTAVVTWVTPPGYSGSVPIPEPPIGGTGMAANDIWDNQAGSY